MKVKVRCETVPRMIELCKKHKAGNLDEKELIELLEHEDYIVEFNRYNSGGNPRGGFSKEEYIEFFMNFFSLCRDEIKNERLKLRYNDLKYLFDNLDFYESQLINLNYITEDVILESLKYTFDGLPESLELENLDFIFSIGLGNSGGWFYDNCSHYDMVIFFKNFDLECIKHYFAHETHHVGLAKYVDSLGIEKDLTLEECLYLLLAVEGLAVKYCNNGEGVLTKRIYKDEPENIGLDKYSWDYLNKEFYTIYDTFREHTKKLRSKEITDLEQIISEYWFSLHTSEQSEDEAPKLRHSRNYSLGNELWGLINDVYGKDKVFDTIKNIKYFPQVLSSALITIGREDLIIE
jgi:hypothetical protein